MAKQVQKFQSDAGGLFDTECAALKDDLRHQIMQVTKNEKIANDLADHITSNLAGHRMIETPGDPPVFAGWVALITALGACSFPQHQ